jgi:hypothetical protein
MAQVAERHSRRFAGSLVSIDIWIAGLRREAIARASLKETFSVAFRTIDYY